MVLEAGKISKFDAPQTLMKRDSLFRTLCVEAGIVKAADDITQS